MRLLPSLFLLFLAVPLLEVYLLIEVGQAFGAGITIAAVVATALLGAALARYQGMVTLTNLYTQLYRGELPAQALFEGACLLVAGALLLTPGFFTDAVGFALLTPPLRRWAYRMLWRRLRTQMDPFGPAKGPKGSQRESIIIERKVRRRSGSSQDEFDD